MPHLVASQDGVPLDHKARQMIIKALRCQMSVWQLGDDAFADMQNDLLYAEGLLATMQKG